MIRGCPPKCTVINILGNVLFFAFSNFFSNSIADIFLSIYLYQQNQFSMKMSMADAEATNELGTVQTMSSFRPIAKQAPVKALLALLKVTPNFEPVNFESFFKFAYNISTSYYITF